MACKFNHVLKGANECKENPAGLSNFCMIVPLDSDHIASIEVNDEKNQNLYARYAELAHNEKNVIFGGRLAEYKYYDMDDVIKRALECAAIHVKRG